MKILSKVHWAGTFYQHTNEDGIKRRWALWVSTSALLLLGTVFKSSVHPRAPAVRPKWLSHTCFFRHSFVIKFSFPKLVTSIASQNEKATEERHMAGYGMCTLTKKTKQLASAIFQIYSQALFPAGSSAAQPRSPRSSCRSHSWKQQECWSAGRASEQWYYTYLRT